MHRVQARLRTNMAPCTRAMQGKRPQNRHRSRKPTPAKGLEEKGETGGFGRGDGGGEASRNYRRNGAGEGRAAAQGRDGPAVAAVRQPPGNPMTPARAGARHDEARFRRVSAGMRCTLPSLGLTRDAESLTRSLPVAPLSHWCVAAPPSLVPLPTSGHCPHGNSSWPRAAFAVVVASFLPCPRLARFLSRVGARSARLGATFSHLWLSVLSFGCVSVIFWGLA